MDGFLGQPLEALFFNEIESNPSKTLYALSESELNVFYSTIEIWIKNYLNLCYRKFDKKILEPKISVNNDTLMNLHSDRKKAGKF